MSSGKYEKSSVVILATSRRNAKETHDLVGERRDAGTTVLNAYLDAVTT